MLKKRCDDKLTLKTAKDLAENFIKDVKILHKAWDIAEIAHDKLYRKDGTPYIYHILSVLGNVYQMYETGHHIIVHNSLETDGNLKTITLCVAILHDVIEDNPKVAIPLIEEELVKLFDPNDFRIFYDNLKAITKKPRGEEEYADYVLRIKEHLLARIVKVADLEHNMSDLAPGNLRDKYSLTKYFLENDLI